MKRFKIWEKGGSLWSIFILFIIVLFSFEIMPIITILYNSFMSKQGFGLYNYHKIFTSKFYLIAFKNSIIISLLSSTIGLIIGILAANSMNNMKEKSKDSILNFVNMTANFGGVPLSFAYIIMLGSNGFMTLLLSKIFRFNLNNYFSLYSWAGLSMVYVYFQVPVSVMMIYPAFYGLKEQWKEAALNLGASVSYYWIKVAIPVLLPSIIGTFSILFANSMGAYATAYALTSGNFSLITIRLSNLIAGDVNLNPQLASAIAVVLGVLMVLSVLVNNLMISKMGGRNNVR